MKASDVRALSQEEMQQKLVDLKQELFNYECLDGI